MQPGSIDEFMSLVLAALLGLPVRLLQVHLFPKIAQGRFDIVTRDVAMRCRKVILDRRLWPCSGLCFNPVLLFTSLSLSRSWSLSLRLSLSLSLSLCLLLSRSICICVSGPTVRKQPLCLLLWPTLFRHLVCRITADRRCRLSLTQTVSHFCSSNWGAHEDRCQ
jgi:hypothetical protein